MPYQNTVILKVQKGFNAATLLQHGFELQPVLNGKFIGFEAQMEQSGKQLFEELLKLDKIQKLLVYQKSNIVVHADKKFSLRRTVYGLSLFKTPNLDITLSQVIFRTNLASCNI